MNLVVIILDFDTMILVELFMDIHCFIFIINYFLCIFFLFLLFSLFGCFVCLDLFFLSITKQIQVIIDVTLVFS